MAHHKPSECINGVVSDPHFSFSRCPCWWSLSLFFSGQADQQDAKREGQDKQFGQEKVKGCATIEGEVESLDMGGSEVAEVKVLQADISHHTNLG